ncbi:MAG: potassium-transporting ATPase subunit KdpA [Betaproteobacteria bacterium]|nr:potassium-transporting ATPase subunit KdpA [Betaproteobacteria bacterium]MBU6510807.1 potassium-transporting ATPase subunit KdpA [Betaproteobacteria bacterium]MDE1954266.1 potassium-transporting ATPase subunit KdpA [Betaproteobacteria bacterium]MDE2150930.1 potassium-transporting ATPase subunit KdpA [Betaproteobacteria bacterium]
MTPAFWVLLAVLFAALLLVGRPLGLYMAALAEGRMPPALLALEARLLGLAGVRPGEEMGWGAYARALLLFNVLGVLAVYALQRLQGVLPLNPRHFGAPSPDSAFNTAISFVTNTNWQGYSGESTMGNLVQMAALAVQNFLSAATGIAVAFAMVRGFARRGASTIGNFWVDLHRITSYVLLPLSFVFAIVLVSQGVPQTLRADRTVDLIAPVSFQVPGNDAQGHPLSDARGQPVMAASQAARQTLPLGPVASQEAIKELGTNGGGFYNANSAHPYENPDALSNGLEIFALLLISVALSFTFGRMVGDPRQGWALLAAMAILLGGAMAAEAHFEQQGNPALVALHVDQKPGALQSGGSMEGKETRFGIASTAVFTAATTGTSTGAVNSMLDSNTPLGGLVPMLLIQLGEVAPGGTGTGLYGMLLVALMAVFVGGLMIGRTPEYLGKKIESFEMKMVSIGLLVSPLLVVLGTAVASVTAAGLAGPANPGAHGFSEMLYAFTSASNNNGSAFAGLNANTPFYNLGLGLAMWFGRFVSIVAALAIAGSLASKKRLAASSGTMPTHGALFVSLLLGTVLLVAALTFLPALALGPIAEHLALWAGH